jgi:hypothetical protein
MERKQVITMKFDSGLTHRVYVYYDTTQHGTRTMTDVCLPGDLMSVKDKMSERELAQVNKLLNRNR